MWPRTSAWRHALTSQPADSHVLLQGSVVIRGELRSIGVRRANHWNDWQANQANR
jgi:hypothetical protein